MENGKEKRELNSISIIRNEGWAGKTVITDKRYGDGENKYSITVPVPETEEDCQTLYSIPLVELISAGVIQKWYGARNVDNVIKEKREAGITAEQATEDVALAVMEQTFEVVPRASISKEMKVLKSELKDLGMTPAEAIAALKAIKLNQA